VTKLPVWIALLAGIAPAGEAPDTASVTALFRMFLRDSAELPMDVLVRTVVTDSKGHQKRNTQATIHLLFRGYSEKAERFTFQSRAGLWDRRVMNDSMTGDLAVFGAFSRVMPDRDGKTRFQTIEDGSAVVVRSSADDCNQFEWRRGDLYPERGCTAVEFRLGRGSRGELRIERFRLEALHLPARGNVRYLGPAMVQKYEAEGDVQEAYLADDPRPFLAPKRVVTTIETDKGKIVVTEEHKLAGKK
jgi:hypothetical protein